MGKIKNRANFVKHPSPKARAKARRKAAQSLRSGPVQSRSGAVQMDPAGEAFGFLSGAGEQCRHISAEGVRCLSPAMVGGYHCRAHTPKD